MGRHLFIKQQLFGMMLSILAFSEGMIACSGSRSRLLTSTENNDSSTLQPPVEILEKHTVDNSLAGAFGVHAVDLDGDIDILGAARDEDWVVWYENDGAQNFTKQPVSQRRSFDGPRMVQTADFDNDGDLDVVSAALEGGAVAWWENDGAGVFTKYPISNIASDIDGPYGIYADDIDLDGDIEVLAADQFNNDIVWWEMQP